jgi:hypothetical protein
MESNRARQLTTLAELQANLPLLAAELHRGLCDETVKEGMSTCKGIAISTKAVCLILGTVSSEHVCSVELAAVTHHGGVAPIQSRCRLPVQLRLRAVMKARRKWKLSIAKRNSTQRDE